MSGIAIAWLKAALLPPVGLIVLSFLGLFAPRPWRLRMLASCTVALALLSMPAVPYGLASLIAAAQPYRPATPPLEQAIVVLGGGVLPFAPEYNRPDVAFDTLQRLRLGARLRDLTGLPLAVSGGVPVRNSSLTLADVMAEILEREYRAPVAWRERRSLNTLENAIFTAEILRAAGITRVVIVTDALHMPRALWSFRRAGLRATAAPIAFAPPFLGLADMIPRIDGLVATYYLAYETVGMAWYLLADLLGYMPKPAATEPA